MTQVPTPEILAAAERELRTLVRFLESEGVVPTVTQRPREPLAMGNYETVVEVRALNPNIFGATAKC